MSKNNSPPPLTEGHAEPKPLRGKTGALVSLMRRDEGAPLTDLMAATGWQAHSVRGAIAGTVKKRLGLAVTTEKGAAGLIYRIAAEPQG